MNAGTVTTSTDVGNADAGTLQNQDDRGTASAPGSNSGPRAVAVDQGTIGLAREAAVQDAGGPDLVGDYLTAETEDDVAVTLRFAMTDHAYAGWTWCTTVAMVDPDRPTVSEVVLLPGPDALLPPRWLPWNERVRPGDLGPGDLLLTPADDPRLVPAYLESDDPAVEDVAHELGIGRVRVMSRPGRTDTAERWHEGSFGPDSDMAKAAPAHCVMCAFYLPLGGSLGAQFGVCGNEMSPADGRAVDAAYGCGAHSELIVEPVPTGFRESHIDDTVLDVHPRTPGEPAGPAEFLAEQPEDLEFQPVHPDSVLGAAAEPGTELDPPELEDAPVEIAELDPPELEEAPAQPELGESPVEVAELDPPELEQAPAEPAAELPDDAQD